MTGENDPKSEVWVTSRGLWMCWWARRTVALHLLCEQEPQRMNEGGCLCGKVRYHVTTEPSDVINCNCSFCQRCTGAAYMVETLFAKEALAVTHGATKVYEHISEGSGKTVYVNFCADCGTKLFLTFDRFPTCLLYTSPSPRDGLLSRMPSSA